MDSILVNGGTPLCGAVKIQGSKNAALPIMAASLLTKDCNFLENCPRITDVYRMIEILESIGCKAIWKEDGLYLDSSGVYTGAIPDGYSEGMRSSIFLLGALLGSVGEVSMSGIGGCVIGNRKIDYHVMGLTRMGATISSQEDRIQATAAMLFGTAIQLPGPSVGATENLVLAAVLAKGETLIQGAAAEPEIVALCQYLSRCGARITGAGSDCIRVEGVKALRGVRYTIPPDRIVAGTYLFATIATGGNVFLQKAPWRELYEPLAVAERMGAVWNCCEEGIYIQGPERPKAVGELITGVYPRFPTDLQSAALVASCVATGQTIIREKIFENRFRIVPQLRKLGANIRDIDEESVEIQGIEQLQGAEVEAMELRGGAALMLAGLCAKGSTLVQHTAFLYRGYENICRDLRDLGARVASV